MHMSIRSGSKSSSKLSSATSSSSSSNAANAAHDAPVDLPKPATGLQVPRETTTSILKPPEPPKTHKVPRRSPFGALLSRTLPNYTGSHEVGVCDVEIPVPRQTFGTFRYKKMPYPEVGLAMDTVLFSLFYPCETPKNPTPTVWFPKLQQTIDGFLKMARRTPNAFYRVMAYPLAAAAISGTTFPANKDATLKQPENGQKWPLMLFSHGVGCSRLMYSAFCGEMASRGYIVAALEHRDGTSPSSTIAAEDGTTTTVDWMEWSELQWPELDPQPEDDTTLRHEQLKLRVAELEATVGFMKEISTGESPKRYSGSAPDFDWGRWVSIDPTRPVMCGHSLGGSAALVISSTSNIDFKSVVVFDPAVQRLEPWKSPILHPLLVINSEEFTVGREYRIFSEQMARTAVKDVKVFSIGGATHPSFSDVFLILPEFINKLTGLGCPAHAVLERTVRATEQYLSGELLDTEHGTGGRVSFDQVYRDEEDMKRKRQEARQGKKKKKSEKEEDPAQGGEEPSGKLYRPVGKPGELAWHQL